LTDDAYLAAGIAALAVGLWTGALGDATSVEPDMSALKHSYEGFGDARVVSMPDGYVVEYFRDNQEKMCATSWFQMPGTNTWNKGIRATLYFIGIIYMFFGISIISDIFMTAVEVITSSERKVKLGDGTTAMIKVWNPTVANLSLMAVGSSAPEIMLAVVETGGTLGGSPGELGPSTIVGSAAFNLLVITAVCVTAVGPDTVKRISQLDVFILTAVWSLAVYIWMLIVLEYWTPGVVTAIEAWITFLAMGVFLGSAYGQDQKWFGWFGDACKTPDTASDDGSADDVMEKGKIVGVRTRPSTLDDEGQITNTAQKDMKKLIRLMQGQDMRDKNHRQDVAQQVADSILSSEVSPSKSLMYWKINSRRFLAGARSHYKHKGGSPRKKQAAALMAAQEIGSAEDLMSMANRKASFIAPIIPGLDQNVSILTFSAQEYRVMENAGVVEVVVRRHGNMQNSVQVEVFTNDGTAKDGKDYKGVRKVLDFMPWERKVIFEVPIIDDDLPEPDVAFSVQMKNQRLMGSYGSDGESDEGVSAKDVDLVDSSESAPSPRSNGSPARKDGKAVRLGTISLAQVVIVDDDHPGELGFEIPMVEVKESIGKAKVAVRRQGGASGTVRCKYHTTDGSAVADEDYLATAGEIEFLPEETERIIEIEILDNDREEPDRVFHIFLSEPEGTKFSKYHIVLVKIIDDDSLEDLEEEVRTIITTRMKGLTTVRSSWGEQFVDAMRVGGDVDEDGNESEPSGLVYLMHFLTIAWKVLFACVPPTDYCGGWATFFVSLLFIGATTSVVEQLASLFGCAVGLKDPFTAITLVALGTSLPDTFASKQAAEEADDADAAVGNVTGSNTVNVLLGLGLPWIMGAHYYQSQGELTGNKYCYPSSSLAYSVLVFTCCALVCLAILMWRRYQVGGELGGAGRVGASAVLVSLWVLYITMSGLKIYGHISYGSETPVDTFGCRCDAPHSSGIGC